MRERLSATPELGRQKHRPLAPTATYENACGVDAVVVPGGSGARCEVENPATVRWLTETCAKASWVMSVCTASFLLVACGIARKRSVIGTLHRVSAMG
jgi:putative intracellular protease/amidase